MKKFPLYLLFVIISCSPAAEQTNDCINELELRVLGIAQDAGFPQADCEKENCQLYWEGKVEKRYTTSLGLIDKQSGQSWMFEATPDFKVQLQILKKEGELTGIFLTHAHIGHYTGLMQVGHEVMGASNMPVYAMPRMEAYLQNNGPWSQLVDYRNIQLIRQQADSTIHLNERLSVTPFLVPHRDEYSETIGYRIESDSTKILFIPDINKWDIWDRSIAEEISKVDHAFLDGTFFDQNELPGRDISQIPHPFIEESLALFKDLPASEKKKVVFIHFNHTNPLILDSPERKQVEALGFRVAYEGMKIGL